MAQLFGLARVGKDVEIRQAASGDPVASVSLAFTWGRKDETGKRRVTWVEGSLWGKRAESLAQYLTKGTTVAVTLDDVELQQFTTRDGQPGAKIAGKITGIDLARVAEQREAPPPPPPPKPVPSRGFDDMDDDVPF